MGRRTVQQLLADLIGKEAEWGRDDCFLSAADVCLAQTGFDPAATVRGRWASKAEAYRVILGYGKDLRDAMHNGLLGLGYRVIDPATALPGDLGALTTGPAIFTAAARIDAGWFVRAERGFRVLPTVDIAWRRE